MGMASVLHSVEVQARLTGYSSAYQVGQLWPCENRSPTTEHPLTSIEEVAEGDSTEDVEFPLVIRTVVQLHDALMDKLFIRGWHMTESGNPFLLVPERTTFQYPDFSEWPKRSTLIQLADFSWELVEHCVPSFTKINYEGEIPERLGCATFVATILHKVVEPISVFGKVLGEDVVQAGGADFLEVFRQDRSVPGELLEGQKPDEIDQQDPFYAGGRRGIG